MKKTEVTAVHYRRSLKRPASSGFPIGSESGPGVLLPASLAVNDKAKAARQTGRVLAFLIVLSLLIALVLALYLAFTTRSSLGAGCVEKGRVLVAACSSHSQFLNHITL